MNIALIFAGGTGTRMKSGSIPKQFLEIFGKPTIIHTLEKFDECDMVDEIVIVCLKDWISHLKGLLDKFNIKKAVKILEGGATGFESRYKGISYLAERENRSADDIVLIHDGVRPMIADKLIKECIEAARKHGNAITVSKATETVLFADGDNVDSLDRSKCLFARAPQVFYLDEIYKMYAQALADGNQDMIDSATIANHYGAKLFFVEGNVDNIKMTSPMDYYLLRGLLEAKEYAECFGGRTEND